MFGKVLFMATFRFRQGRKRDEVRKSGRKRFQHARQGSRKTLGKSQLRSVTDSCNSHYMKLTLVVTAADHKAS